MSPRCAFDQTGPTFSTTWRLQNSPRHPAVREAPYTKRNTPKRHYVVTACISFCRRVDAGGTAAPAGALPFAPGENPPPQFEKTIAANWLSMDGRVGPTSVSGGRGLQRSRERGWRLADRWCRHNPLIADEISEICLDSG